MEAAGGKMDLRPRRRQYFSGFTDSEVQKMEHLLYEFRDQSLEDEFCKKLARVFNRSSRRAGKPAVKWAEIQSWFQQNLEGLSTENSFNGTKMSLVPEGLAMNKATETPKLPEANTDLLDGVKDEDLSKLEFEARSAKDGAWYDVDDFLSHRFLSSGDIEVRVRYVGLGDEEDEWVNVRESVRVCSIALEPSDCQEVNIGDLVVCFQTSQDQARYYDAHVVDIQRRCHDIRGCRCLFLIRYDHDNTEERVRLRRLCCRPSELANLE